MASHLAPFAEADLAAATAHLRHHHAADAPHLAHAAPAFEPAAASWAAAALYRAMQLTFLRDAVAAAQAEGNIALAATLLHQKLVRPDHRRGPASGSAGNRLQNHQR